MAILKNVSIHKAPKKFLCYILDTEKNHNLQFASSVNCDIEINRAYKIFKTNFEAHSFKSFVEKEDISNPPVKLHHYIQSFSPDENDKLTPDEVHKLGVELVKRCFGENAVAVISTHLDKGHLHNHIALSPYTLDGKHIISNERTLEKYRKISDKICEEHGLSIIKVRKHKNTAKYNEYVKRQKGESWKAKVADTIDRLILDPSVTNIEDMKQRLEEIGFKVRLGKYMTITVPDSYLSEDEKKKKNKRSNSIRTGKRLGDGYEIEDIIYRIEHKDKEISKAAIENLTGEKRIQAIFYRQVQMYVFKNEYKRKPKYLYKDLRDMAQLMRVMSENNIANYKDFEYTLSQIEEEYQKQNALIESLNKRLKALDKETGIEADINRDVASKELLIANSRYKELEDRYKILSEGFLTYQKIQNDPKYMAIKNVNDEVSERNDDEIKFDNNDDERV